MLAASNEASNDRILETRTLLRVADSRRCDATALRAALRTRPDRRAETGRPLDRQRPARRLARPVPCAAAQLWPRRSRAPSRRLRPFESTFPAPLHELAILVVAKLWSADYEWNAHRKHAVAAGLDPAIPATIEGGRRPEKLAPDEVLIYDLVSQLLIGKDITDARFDGLAVRARRNDA
jgi:alkylhydroperoxidase family enzyme